MVLIIIIIMIIIIIIISNNSNVGACDQVVWDHAISHLACHHQGFKVVYYSFIRVQEVYTINVQIYFFCINILITIKNPYKLCDHCCFKLQFGKLKGHETGRPCTIRGPGNELEKCVLRENDRYDHT